MHRPCQFRAIWNRFVHIAADVIAGPGPRLRSRACKSFRSQASEYVEGEFAGIGSRLLQAERSDAVREFRKCSAQPVVFEIAPNEFPAWMGNI